jgi:hypothetical protein
MPFFFDYTAMSARVVGLGNGFVSHGFFIRCLPFPVFASPNTPDHSAKSRFVVRPGGGLNACLSNAAPEQQSADTNANTAP